MFILLQYGNKNGIPPRPLKHQWILNWWMTVYEVRSIHRETVLGGVDKGWRDHYFDHWFIPRWLHWSRKRFFPLFSKKAHLWANPDFSPSINTPPSLRQCFLSFYRLSEVHLCWLTYLLKSPTTRVWRALPVLPVCSKDCSNRFSRSPTHLFKSDHSSLTGKDGSQDFAACSYCDLFLMSSVRLRCSSANWRTDFK